MKVNSEKYQIVSTHPGLFFTVGLRKNYKLPEIIYCIDETRPEKEDARKHIEIFASKCIESKGKLLIKQVLWNHSLEVPGSNLMFAYFPLEEHPINMNLEFIKNPDPIIQIACFTKETLPYFFPLYNKVDSNLYDLGYFPFSTANIEKFRHLQRRICGNVGCEKKASETCSRCETTRYCSKECSSEHWPQHKTLCVKDEVTREFNYFLLQKQSLAILGYFAKNMYKFNQAEIKNMYKELVDNHEHLSVSKLYKGKKWLVSYSQGTNFVMIYKGPEDRAYFKTLVKIIKNNRKRGLEGAIEMTKMDALSKIIILPMTLNNIYKNKEDYAFFYGHLLCNPSDSQGKLLYQIFRDEEDSAEFHPAVSKEDVMNVRTIIIGDTK